MRRDKKTSSNLDFKKALFDQVLGDNSAERDEAVYLFANALLPRVMRQQVREYFFIFKRQGIGKKSVMIPSKKHTITNLTSQKKDEPSWDQETDPFSKMAWIDLKVII